MPQFSADGTFIYSLIQFSTSSGAIVRVAVAGGQPEYLIDALDFAVIPVGKYQGDLVVYQHRRKVWAGYYDWFYLMTPDAQEIGVIGQNQDDVYNFVATFIGEPGTCEEWEKPAWMTCINRIR